MPRKENTFNIYPQHYGRIGNVDYTKKSLYEIDKNLNEILSTINLDTDKLKESILYLRKGKTISSNNSNDYLQFGNGTKLDADKGIGKFGIGLPNASVSQCRKVEVYTWQKNKYLY